MNTSINEKEVEPIGATVTAELLTVELSDGRTVAVPTQWFPRLSHGTSKEWANFHLMYGGIHWPDLDEDISVESLLRGEKSGESATSIGRWLNARARGQKVPVPQLPLDSKLANELEKIGVLKRKEPASPRHAQFKASRVRAVKSTR